MRARIQTALALAAVLSASQAGAAVPSTSSVEGMLLSSGGGAAADGTYSANFAIYAAETGGTAIWSESGAALAVKGGQFAYQLGAKTPIAASALNLTKAWLGIQIGSDPELARKPLNAAPYAIRAAVAEALECTGCLKAGNLDAAVLQPYAKSADLVPYAKTADLSAYAKVTDLTAYAKKTDLSSYATTAALADYVKASSLAKVAGTGSYADLLNKPTLATVAASGSYADLTNKPVMAKLGDACGTNLVMKGIKADGSYECVTAGIAPDMINEVSNDLIWNQFTDSAPGTKDVQIKDGFAAGVTDTLTFPDLGVAQKIWVDFNAGNSDVSKLTIELFGPGMSTPYILYKGTKSGTSLVAKYNDTDAISVGDMNKDWIGKNIKGNWSITVKDTLAISVPPGTPAFVYDGKFNWSLSIQTLSSKKVQIKGNLVVDGSVQVGNVANATVPSGAVMHFATANCPAGWVKANGATVNSSDYPGLAAAMGASGATFVVPDLRGEFIRSLDDGRGVDAGRAAKSAQAQDFKSFSMWNEAGGSAYSHGGVYYPKTGKNGNLFGGYWSAPAGVIRVEWDGSEVRPRNVALLACIKG